MSSIYYEVSTWKKKVESKVESLNQKVLEFLSVVPMSKAEISNKLGWKKAYGQLHEAINRLLSEKKIERTIPYKPKQPSAERDAEKFIENA